MKIMQINYHKSSINVLVVLFVFRPHEIIIRGLFRRGRGFCALSEPSQHISHKMGGQLL